MVKLPIKTPCIGVCSTGIGDSVCRGCKRYSHEIVHWNSYSHAQKYAVMQRLQQLLAQVMGARIEIYDVAKLEAGIKANGVRYDPQVGAHVWLFDLLRAGASQIRDLNHFGCRLNVDVEDYTQLRDIIDRDFFILSQAHYSRYFSV